MSGIERRLRRAQLTCEVYCVVVVILFSALVVGWIVFGVETTYQNIANTYKTRFGAPIAVGFCVLTILYLAAFYYLLFNNFDCLTSKCAQVINKIR